jgi:hypothetical protein
METAAPGASRPTLAAVGIQSTTSRLLFVDNIRVLLTILVLLFHLMITYAGTGDWWYMEGREDTSTGVIGAWFLVVNQAYFMGLFLLISAYFVPGSYDRKGTGRFLKDRLIRLGIPLALYSWIIRPLLAYFDPSSQARACLSGAFSRTSISGTRRCSAPGRCGSSRPCSSFRSCTCCGGSSPGSAGRGDPLSG